MTQNNHAGTEGQSRVLWRIVLVVGCIGAIFINSLMNSDISSVQSGTVLRVLQKLFQMLGGNPQRLTMYLVRKLAHFAEYALLGFLLFFCSRQDRAGWFYQPLFFGLLVPVADEGLQLFVPGRTGQVQDVVLDFTGVLFGFATAFLLHKIWAFVMRRFKSPQDRQGL